MEIPRSEFDAALFDMDGVLTDTASLHAAAWKEVLDETLRARADRTGDVFVPFDDADYLAYVDGKPREEGIRSFFASRGVELADGGGSESVRGVGDRKNARFLELVRSRGATVFASTIGFVDELRAAGLRIGLFTASRNMDTLLDGTEVAGRFAVRFGGVERAASGLPGKPAPDVLLEVASMLGVEPARAFVVEDSRAGIEAARRGGFGLAIGVDRGGNEEALRAAGATVVVHDLAEVQLDPAPSVGNLPAALEAWHEVRARLAGRRPAVFLDYDGTLTPIVGRPEDARLAPEMRGAIEDLAATCPVAVVSGRDLADVRAMLGIDGLAVAGSHGFDIVRPDGARFERGEEYLPDLDAAAHALAPLIEPIDGAWIERKRLAIAVHYRQAGAGAGQAVEAAADEVAAAHPRLRRTGGKMIAELRPDIPWDKGRAVRWLLEVLGLTGPDIAPVYVGDDETDEDAFREVRATGLGVVVRGESDDRPTVARYALGDTDAVRSLLGELARLGGGRG